MEQPNTKVLSFNSGYDRVKGLDYGRLCLVDIATQKTEIIKASTSYRTNQTPDSIHRRGGMLPPAYRCKGDFLWSVKTEPIPMPNHRGVRGNFYQLSPFQVTTDRGGIRSDFGIHLDADSPGSMGCIVTDARRFKTFEKWMKQLRDDSIDSIYLLVAYS